MKGKVKTNVGYWEQTLFSPTPAYHELFEEEKNFILEKITPHAKVLDIGCGNGRNIKNILKRTEDIVGIDNDKQAIQDAKENFLNISKIRIVQGEASNLPFKDNTFDFITLLMILPNLDTKKEIVFKESARCLKDNGKILLSTFAETAFDERMRIYKKVNAPIKKIEGTKIIFDKSLGANISEQFSKKDLENLAFSSNLKIVSIKKVGILAYLCLLEKI